MINLLAKLFLLLLFIEFTITINIFELILFHTHNYPFFFFPRNRSNRCPNFFFINKVQQHVTNIIEITIIVAVCTDNVKVVNPANGKNIYLSRLRENCYSQEKFITDFLDLFRQLRFRRCIRWLIFIVVSGES